MNVIDTYVIKYITCFLTKDELYAFRETCKIFELIIFEMLQQYDKKKGFILKSISPPSSVYIVQTRSLLEWAQLHKGFMYDSDMLIGCVQNEDIDTLRYILNDCTYTDNFKNLTYIMDNAVRKGNLEIVKCLRKSGFRWSYNSINIAVEYVGSNDICWNNKYFRLVEYLLFNDSGYNRNTTSVAAKHGNLELLKYLIENDCEYNKVTFSKAVMSDNLEVLKYLKKIKCAYSKDIFKYAINKNNFEAIDWLLKNKFRQPENLSEYAIETGNMDMYIYLLKRGCSYDPDSVGYNMVRELL